MDIRDAVKQYEDNRIGRQLAEAILNAIRPFKAGEVSIELVGQYSYEVRYFHITVSCLPDVEFKFAPDLSTYWREGFDAFAIDLENQFRKEFLNYKVEPEAHIILGDN